MLYVFMYKYKDEPTEQNIKDDFLLQHTISCFAISFYELKRKQNAIGQREMSKVKFIQ